MKGMVFNLLESFITDRFGEDVYEDIAESAQLITQEPFVGPGIYPDEDFMELVNRACERLKVTPQAASRLFGHYSFSKLAHLHTFFLQSHTSALEFIRSVDGVIHVEVLKLYPDVTLPKFDYDQETKDSLSIKYTSERRLCFFMEGLIQGCAEHFGDQIEFEQSTCYHKGDDHCMFHLREIKSA